MAFHRADVGFHEAVAMAGGNRILTCLFEAMARPLQRSFIMSRRGRQLRGQTSEDTLAAHGRILDRVRARDPAGAEEAMRAHLADAGRDMRAAFDATRPVETEA
jgi:DNA-binding FadR family transcriptional regulator